MDTVTELGSDFRGLLAISCGPAGNIVYYLTRCCRASVTGVGCDTDNPDGVACRACYRPVPVGLAWAWEEHDADAWERWEAAWAAASPIGAARGVADQAARVQLQARGAVTAARIASRR